MKTSGPKNTQNKIASSIPLKTIFRTFNPEKIEEEVE